MTPAQLARHADQQRAYVERNRERERSLRSARIKRRRRWTLFPHRAATVASESNARAERLGAPGRLTAADVRAITGPCAYCGGEAGGWDHVVPMGRGGANVASNLVRSCFRCNCRKNLRTPEEAEMPILAGES